jgi:cephalosporin hydroxylase
MKRAHLMVMSVRSVGIRRAQFPGSAWPFRMRLWGYDSKNPFGRLCGWSRYLSHGCLVPTSAASGRPFCDPTSSTARPDSRRVQAPLDGRWCDSVSVGFDHLRRTGLPDSTGGDHRDGNQLWGLAAFLATVVEGINPYVKIITVDIDSQRWEREVSEGRITPKFRERIVFIKGDSVSSQVLAEVAKYASGKRGFVILDSLHSKQHVLKELNLYSQFVGEGSYLIVNDTHLEILGLMESEPGPFSAVRDFIRSTDDFLIDPNLPGTILSCAPSGFLKRVKTSPTRIEPS